jgi:hypothetical protein
LYIFGSSEKVQQAASLRGSSNFHHFRESTGWQPVVHPVEEAIIATHLRVWPEEPLAMEILLR